MATACDRVRSSSMIMTRMRSIPASTEACTRWFPERTSTLPSLRRWHRGTDDSRLSRPMFAVSCWNTSFFSIRAFFLSREMSFGSMTASVRASPYRALLIRESVSFSVEKSMLPPYLQKVM